MALRQEFRAAAAGRLRGNDSNDSGASRAPVILRRLLTAAAVLVFTSSFGPDGHAQSGPFAGMAGRWSGGGTVSLDDGSTERIRCRATYAVAGPQMQLNLLCASDSYKFDLQGDIVDQGGAISGTWSESSRGVTGSLQGRGGGGRFEVVASAAGFNAQISLTTRGNRQSVVIRADSQFRGATISMSR
jgi:hypothetical protein